MFFEVQTLSYAFKPPPTQIFKLIVVPFWIAQINRRDSLIKNIIFSKATLSQIRSLEGSGLIHGEFFPVNFTPQKSNSRGCRIPRELDILPAIGLIRGEFFPREFHP